MIIGIMGLAGTGKSTVGRILRDDYGFVPVAFASPLKDAVSVLFGWDRALLEGDTVESREFREIKDAYWSEALGKDVTPRWVLQYMGTEVMRMNFSPDFWIRALGKYVSDPSKNYVITDARFANEFEAIQDMGGFLVEVTNSQKKDVSWVKRLEEGIVDWEFSEIEKYMAGLKVHKSEWEHVWWRYQGGTVDFVLHNEFTEAENNTTMEMLKASVQHMMRVFTGPKDVKTQKNVTLSESF